MTKKKAPPKRKLTAKKKVVSRKPKASTKIPAHQWIHKGDEVLILRYVDQRGKSYGGFQHPMEVGEAVTAPDWNIKAECGGGIHGWPWGIALGDGKDPKWDALWQVYGVNPTDIIDIGGKCKFRTGVLRFKGNWHDALMFVLDGQKAWVEHFSLGNGHATGDSSASSATGYSSASSATGDSSASSATGDRSASVVTGLCGRARAGKFGCVALAWWNEKAGRGEMKIAEIGRGDGSDGKLKADVWYELDKKGKFIESK